MARSRMTESVRQYRVTGIPHTLNDDSELVEIG